MTSESRTLREQEPTTYHAELYQPVFFTDRTGDIDPASLSYSIIVWRDKVEALDSTKQPVYGILSAPYNNQTTAHHRV